jgi:PAS domain S-box-containing protein
MSEFPGGLLPKQSGPVKLGGSTLRAALMENLPALLWTADRELRFSTLLGTALQAAGLRTERYLGMAIETFFFTSASRRDALIAHRKALAGENASFEFEILSHDMMACVAPLRAVDGSCAGVVGVALDNTERLTAQRDIRLSEQSCRSLIEELPYAICRTSKSGQLLQVNRAMLEMLGYDHSSERELLLQNLPHHIFVDPESFDEFIQILLNRTAFQGFESRWRCRDGHEIDVNVGGRVMRDNAGEVWHMDILAENITERKQLDAQSRQSQKMQAVTQLAGGIAHDFNNLLMVVEGQVELLLGESLESDVKDRLREVMRAAERASALTKQLLAYSRRQVLQSKTVDLNVLIGRICEALRRLISESIELTFTPAPDPAFVSADASQIEQVLMNLAVNARDAMPQGGQLTIQISNVSFDDQAAQPPPDAEPVQAKPAQYVLLAVSDTGSGMDRETQARVFEPFFSTKEPGTGTGLGLSLVYGVVRQSGGQVRVESNRGRGTTFKVYLPRVSDPESTPSEKATGPPAAKERKTILYAEDDDSVRVLVSTYLTRIGYNVLTAADGVIAKQIAQSHPGAIHLLLTDLIMPNMGGRELAEELRNILPVAKVVFVSGYTGHSIDGEDLKYPGAYFLPKPFPMQLLAKTVRDALDGVSS